MMGPKRRTSSSSFFASAVVSSSGGGSGWASARQCLHARSQAWVVSQMTRKGAWSKSSVIPRGPVLEEEWPWG